MNLKSIRNVNERKLYSRISIENKCGLKEGGISC